MSATPLMVNGSAVMRTPYKDGVHVQLGRVVQQHRAFRASLSAGEYQTVLTVKFPEFQGIPGGELVATVHLVIIP